MKFYKATRPDGTSFHDSKTKWEVGGVVEVPAVDDPACCTGNVLHASTEPAETLIGGSWPCRLFVVEGEPVCEEGRKRGFFKLTVVEEIEAWKALGPNGQEVAATIEQAKTITLEQVKGLAAARAAARDAARDAARAVVWDAAWDAARVAVWDAAWDAAWAAARDAARAVARAAARDAAWAVARAAARDAAWDAARVAAWDAATALVTRDLITDEQFHALYDPWHSVMGDPKEQA